MDELYEGLDLNQAQINVICRGLFDLSAVDGVDASEKELIEGFYAELGSSEKLDDVLKQAFDLNEAVTVLADVNARNAFFITCYLLIYADGEFSEAELTRINEFAKAFNLSDGEQNDLHLKARMYLLKELAQSLKNRDVVRQVGASMGLAENDIDSLLK